MHLINSLSFSKEVLESEEPVVVEFYRPEGCGNCVAMKPIMERFEMDNPTVKVCLYECGKEQDEITKKYQFRMFPGIFSFNKGQVIRGFSGTKSLQQMSLIFSQPQDLNNAIAFHTLQQAFFVKEIQEYNQGIQVVEDKPEVVEDFALPTPTAGEPEICEGCQ